MKLWQATIAGAALLALAVPEGLDSCAIGPSLPVFATRQRPADLKDQFLKGKVGVLRRTYQQKYLVTAFRILNGVPLTDDEVEALFPANPSDAGWVDPVEYTAGWVTALGGTLHAGDPPLDTYKTVNSGGLVYSFRNCTKDAFNKAGETLADLNKEWGEKDPKTLEWIQAQQQVFANCSGKEPVIPAPPAAGMDSTAAAYRRYQIAAAYFYSGQFHKAADAFEKIAVAPEAPFRDMAPYLVARCLLRAGLVDGNRASFDEGKKRLLAIIDDPDQEDWHDPARDLLHLWQLRVEPRTRLIELGAELMQPGDEHVAQSVTDFLYAVNHHQDTTTRTWTAAELTELENSSELAAWMLAMSANPPVDAGQRSLDWWRKKKTPAWLIAALANAPNPALDELVKAATAIAPADPAYESVSYYSIQREIAANRAPDARSHADRVLAKTLLLSSRNLILAERTGVALTLDEFLKFGLRRPEPNVSESEGSEEYIAPQLPAGAALFDWDLIDSFNYQMPLSLWIAASASPSLPKNMQSQLALGGWLRAIFLEDYPAARQLMQRIADLEPEAAAISRDFLAARDPEDIHLAALYIILREPSLQPALSGVLAPDIKLAAPHNIPEWNCTDCLRRNGDKPVPSAAPFLTPEQRAAGIAEAARLKEADFAQATPLIRQTLDWARKRPADPRLPEALHRAVMASRYRATDPETGAFSKQAFDLLHARYPRSPWTAQTPYWYK